ncbi:hypothetical protein [Pontibacter chitinilyticus]|uniref:hypothetical protein n=1 Tax=Pontibacter chitinilyticus TaxID=2674989 RepID=UPI003219BB78
MPIGTENPKRGSQKQLAHRQEHAEATLKGWKAPWPKRLQPGLFVIIPLQGDGCLGRGAPFPLRAHKETNHD